jgi:hypothetical protein
MNHCRCLFRPTDVDNYKEPGGHDGKNQVDCDTVSSLGGTRGLVEVCDIQGLATGRLRFGELPNMLL